MIDILHLDRVLHRLHELCRICGADELRLLLQNIRDAHTDMLRVDHDFSLDGCLFKKAEYLTVFAESDSDLFRIGAESGVCLRALDKEMKAFLPDQRMAERDRVTLDIIPAHIERPADVVKLREKEPVTSFLRKCTADLPDFFLRCLSCQVF